MSKNKKRPECDVETDAVPFEENQSSKKPTEDSSGSDELKKESPIIIPKVGSETLPYSSVTIGSSSGNINIGSNYVYNITNSKNFTIGSTTIEDSGSDDSSEEYEDSDSDSEPEINEKILNSSLCLSTNNKQLVSENIGNNYHKLARHLKGANFTTIEINNIMSSNTAFGIDEGIYQILERWSEKAPKQATVGNLAAALQKLNRIDLANKLSLDDLTNDLAEELEKL